MTVREFCKVDTGQCLRPVALGESPWRRTRAFVGDGSGGGIL